MKVIPQTVLDRQEELKDALLDGFGLVTDLDLEPLPEKAAPGGMRLYLKLDGGPGEMETEVEFPPEGPTAEWVDILIEDCRKGGTYNSPAGGIHDDYHECLGVEALPEPEWEWDPNDREWDPDDV